jgi:peptidoglycan/xylan/chitin deacetylase (PgdA/CDA1 family)
MRIKDLLISNKISSFLLRKVSKSFDKIFFYHRFSKNYQSKFLLIDEFEKQVNYICKYYKVISLNDFITKRLSGRLCKNEVVLTVDDGYRDFYELAYPILIKYEIPATLFVTLDFVEEKIWMWWDLIEYLLIHNKRAKINFKHGNFEVSISNDIRVQRSWDEIASYCLYIDDKAKWELIDHLVEELNVNVPQKPTTPYAPVSMDHLKVMVNNGISIGLHTKTHPILSKVTPKVIEEEVVRPKHRLEQLLGMEVLTFCYPNGQPEDFNEQVVEKVKEAGYLGAVVSYISLNSKFNPYTIYRIGAPNSLEDFLWKLYGGELLTYKLLY